MTTHKEVLNISARITHETARQVQKALVTAAQPEWNGPSASLIQAAAKITAVYQDKSPHLIRQGMSAPNIAALAVIMLNLYSAPVMANPVLTEQTGTANPMNGEDVGAESAPSLADLDDDADFDVISGSASASFNYYNNIGTTTAPAYIGTSGAANPMDGLNTGGISSKPALVDIDDDGDMDAFAGSSNGSVLFYENTGSSTNPAFTNRNGAGNPFDAVDVGNYSAPAFVDIDDDGDMDAFIGNFDGAILYYQNTGTPTNPAFTEQTGADNPLSGPNVVLEAKPSFIDIDGDSDMDAFIGNAIGTFRYFENTGTPTAPLFTERTGAANPFNGIDLGGYSTVAFADLDDDGDADALTGDNTGGFRYFRNDAPQIIAFSPADEATGVNPEGKLVITFSEPVFAQTGNIVIKRISDDSTVETLSVTGSAISGSGTDTITFSPGVLPQEQSLYVQMDATAFDNASSHSVLGISTNTRWNFTTRGLPAQTDDLRINLDSSEGGGSLGAGILALLAGLVARKRKRQ